MRKITTIYLWQIGHWTISPTVKAFLSDHIFSSENPSLLYHIISRQSLSLSYHHLTFPSPLWIIDICLPTLDCKVWTADLILIAMSSIQATNSNQASPRRRRRNHLAKLFCNTKSETRLWKINLKGCHAGRAAKRHWEQDDTSLTYLAEESFAESSVRSLSSDSSSISSTALQKKKALQYNSQELSLRHSFANHQTQSDVSDESSSRKVVFGAVTVQYHRLDLGNHPDVSSGVPVTLGTWEGSEQFSVDELEQDRERRRSSCPWEPTLSAKQREQMLLDAGVPMHSIQRRIHALKIQNNLLLRQKLLVSSSK